MNLLNKTLLFLTLDLAISVFILSVLFLPDLFLFSLLYTVKASVTKAKYRVSKSLRQKCS